MMYVDVIRSAVNRIGMDISVEYLDRRPLGVRE
jgi:hypothetical protein